MSIAPLRHLLVPIDYSETSLNALNLAVSMSLRHDAVIRLVHVINPSQYIFSWGANALVDQSREVVVENERQKLQKIADSITADSLVRCSVECRTGVVSETIVETARAFEADVVIMGTHGTSGIREYFMGSEAYRVVKTATCPVLTVPDSQVWTQFRAILFPIRPVPNALDKYDMARTLIRKNKAHLTVLGLLDTQDAAKMNIINQSIASLSGLLIQDDIDGDTLLLETDSVAQTVLQKADELHADLIIITADLDTTIGHFFVGPFAQQIVNRARVPVLSIRPQPSIPLRMQSNMDLRWPELPSFNLFPPVQIT